MRLEIDQLEKLGLGSCLIFNAAGKTFENGKFDVIADIPHVFDAAQGASILVSVDYSVALDQARDLDPAEKERLVAFLQEKLDLPQDKIEANIEKVLDLAIRQAQLVCEGIAITKEMFA